jgi:phosphatidylethanolamine-binding protein (PEBP) family uncharacterized protein
MPTINLPKLVSRRALLLAGSTGLLLAACGEATKSAGAAANSSTTTTSVTSEVPAGSAASATSAAAAVRPPTSTITTVAGVSNASAPSATASTFSLTSPVMTNGGILPVTFTCDGDSTSPPLAWSGAPLGTVGYAVIMHHVPGPGDTHWYWVLYDIPATVDHIDAGVNPTAKVGTNSVNNQLAYAPPCSKGPGAKTYTLTAYALSGQPKLTPAAASRDALLTALDGLILAEAHLDVTYTRS